MNTLAVVRALARYGPDTAEIREGMKDLLAARIDVIWSLGLSEPSNTDQRAMKTGFGLQWKRWLRQFELSSPAMIRNGLLSPVLRT